MQETHLIQWLVLAFVQGLTEYLPISSTAHLILISRVMNWQDQGVIMDIAAHGGSLFAVVWFFKSEIKALFQGNNWSLFNQLALSSLPLALFGYLFSGFIINTLRTPEVIAVASIVFGLLLYVADGIQKRRARYVQSMNIKKAVLIGMGQVFALIPGASRSGVTMSAAMAMGFNRTTAARFSFLLAIPALLMTSAYMILKLIKQPEEVNIIGVMVVLSVSFVASLLSIKLFLKLIENMPLSLFVWYRVVLALMILWFLK